MLRYGLLLLGALLMAPYADAAYVVDLYGDSSPMAQHILKKYNASVIQFIEQAEFVSKKQIESIVKKSASSVSKEQSLALSVKRHQLYESIKKEGHYAYANLTLVLYPGDKTHYITIEVVRPSESDRLKWTDPDPLQEAPPARFNDIVQTMQDYLNIAGDLAIKGQFPDKPIHCSGYHCIFGFDHPKLKPFEALLRDGARRNVPLIMKVLHDKDSERRVAAIYLVGEWRDNPQYNINTVLPYVDDPDSAVRNAAIRVIGGTLFKAKQCHVDVAPFIRLLRSPQGTDRNKSLFVLFAEAKKDPAVRKLLRQQAYASLKELAALKQPNNHDVAVKLIKMI